MCSSFWNFVWSMVIIFAFVAYLMILFQILGDLSLRDNKAAEVVKAIWIVFLVLLPYLTALVYVIVRGKDMGSRATAKLEHDRQTTQDFIRQAAGRSPAQEISDAMRLLHDGIITADEFGQLKATALSC